MKLNEIRDNPGSRPKRTRLGRGMGSGKGKTAGRGQKGQKARTGVRMDGFEGGQMPIFRRLPKRGFANIFRLRYSEINLDRLQKAIEEKKIDPQAIDAVSVVGAGLIGHARDGLKLLGKGEIKAAIKITVSGASQTAIAAVEKAGGSVTVLPKPARPEGKLKPKNQRAAA